MVDQNILSHTWDVTSTGDVRLVCTLDKFAFVMNTVAMGDVICCVPVVVKLINDHYKTGGCAIVVKLAFWDLFPESVTKWLVDYDNGLDNWGLGDGWAFGLLNRKVDGKIVRGTPKRMLLGQYGGLAFGDRIFDRQDLAYVPIAEESVDHFGVDFSRAVIIVGSYRDDTRKLLPGEIDKVVDWIISQQLIPVVIGKTQNDLIGAKSDVNIKPGVVDLRNQTTIKQLVGIFNRALLVIGVDSGPIHLAGTTAVDIICGYTSVSGEYRVPIRQQGRTIVIEPNISCIGCESRWRTSFWNFEKCFLGNIACVTALTGERIINCMKPILENKTNGR